MRYSLAIASFALTGALAFDVAANVRHDEGIGFYIGLDGQQAFTSGTYAGLANPNANRLTLLFDHGDHFHGIGAYSYAGAPPHPAVLPTNANNRIPETFSLEGPLPLSPGDGLYTGRLRSMVGDSEYSYLGMASVQTLAGAAPGSAEDILLNSSGGRWAGALDGMSVGLKLLAATSGLKIGTETVADLFASSDTILLGAGNSLEFKPVYWVDGNAAPGTYSAQFRLVNLTSGTPFGDSGSFSFDFVAAPVPEPGSWAMLFAGLAMLGWIARRRAG